MLARSELFVVVGTIALVAAFSLVQGRSAADESSTPEHAAAQVEPKPITPVVRKGLDYLVSQQHADGGWGQGGGWRSQKGGGFGNARVEGENVTDAADLGNTCMALLALIRAGNTPRSGEYAQHVARGAEFVFAQVERSETATLYVTDVRDTQLQRKIGQFADTFLAGLVLSELKGHLPGDRDNQRLELALAKVVAKIETHQQTDGTFAGNHGWASVLSQGLCSKFLNRAAQQKVAIDARVLERDFHQSLASLDEKPAAKSLETAMPREMISARPGGRPEVRVLVGAAAGDAGIELYRQATNVGRINHFYDSNRPAEQAAEQVLASASASDHAKDAARRELARVAQVRGVQQDAVGGIIEKLSDERFVAGFGNNGGEEFLSYMNISETLVQQRGEKWETWDKSISARLARVQNGDGSWSGQHCITGRTFCTSASLLTLLADRAPLQLATQLASQP